jgi:Kef-type K+ transport system membrane component KefB
MSGVLISQLGEFSFLLAASATAVAAISPEESKLIISVTVLSLALSPFWLSTARRLQRIGERRLSTLKLVFDATFVGERLLARRSSRWTRRVAENLWAQVHAFKKKRAEKRAIKKALELPPQPQLTDQSKQPDTETPKPEAKGDG